VTADLTAITTVGGLLPVDLLARIAAGDSDLPAIKASDYGLAATERTREAISRSWNRLSGLWQAFDDRLAALPDDDPATTPTRELWILPLLDELRFAGVTLSAGIEIDGRGYPISHMAGVVPIHVLGAGTRLDVRTPGRAGAAQLSPHALVQEYLNRSDDHLWGIVTNGRRLRLLRDSTSLTKQAYVEFDLEAIFSEGLFADFTTLWMTMHGTRFTGERPEECVLEQWLSVGHERGVRALDHLRDGVKTAIERLGAGFISHPGNGVLRERLRSNDLDTQDYYRQLLRVVYRLLFLIVAEERGLLHPPDAPAGVRQRYDQHYSISRLRRLAERRRGTAHSDRWEGIKVVTAALGSLEGQPALGLPALGSLLWASSSTSDLTGAQLSNADLLAAMRSLALVEDPDTRRNRRIDYRNMGTEELGSVYESLLELEPAIRLDAGSFQLTNTGGERRDTGAHYTPPTILAKVLDFALDPQIAQRLRRPNPEAALLDLRVLDPAVGSGHFLIAAGHRIARALAQVRTGEQEPAPEIQRQAFRDVVARCLYGVDVNPMAVELAKVALWLEALDPGKPLSFLDHHIRWGNSLLGVPVGSTVLRNRALVDRQREDLAGQVRVLEKRIATVANDRDASRELTHELRSVQRQREKVAYDSWADAIPSDALKAVEEEDDRTLARMMIRDNKRERQSRQLQLGLDTLELELPQDVVEEFSELARGAENSVIEVTARAERYRELTESVAYAHALQLADLWSSVWFWPKSEPYMPVPTQGVFERVSTNPTEIETATTQRVAAISSKWALFHFELAFPEVFSVQRGGFDVIVGNPPYLGGFRITEIYGRRYSHFLKSNTTNALGGVDLVVYFLRRSFDLLNPSGELAFLTTNTVAEGDSRSAGLGQITTECEGIIAGALHAGAFEGDPSVNTVVVHLTRDESRPRLLDGRPVSIIAPDLTDGDAREPQQLRANGGLAYQGSMPLGRGFILTKAEAEALVTADPSNAEVVRSLISAEDATDRPMCSPRRWIINFGDRSLDEAERYPLCLERVRELVKPQRDLDRRRSRRERWWQFGEKATGMYQAIQGLERVIVMPLVSKTMLPVWSEPMHTFTNKVVVFALQDDEDFAVISSGLHWIWAAKYAGSLVDRPTYTPTDCLLTFPFPPSRGELGPAGKQLHECRESVMLERGVGTTKLYNLVVDPECHDEDILTVRAAHVALDEAVARAYGWDDLIDRFDHGHHPTERFGLRWTVKPETQREIEQRLLDLNLARAAAERE
jgi:hypothetical protein